MRSFVFVIFLLLHCSILFSKTIDSLYNYKLNEREIIDLLNNSFTKRSVEIDKFIDNELKRVKSNARTKADFLLATSSYYLRNNDKSSAVKQLKSAENLIKTISAEDKKAIELLIAKQWLALGDKTNAKKYLSFLNEKSRGSLVTILSINNSLNEAILYSSINDNEKKKTALSKADELEKDFLIDVDEKEKAEILCQIVVNSIKLGRYKNLDRYYKQLLNNKNNVLNNDFLYAQALYQDYNNQFIKAEKSYKQLVSGFFNQYKTDVGFEAILRLANLYSKKLIPDSATKYFVLAKKNQPLNSVAKPLDLLYTKLYNEHLNRYKNTDTNLTKLSNAMVVRDSLYQRELNESLKEAEYKFSILSGKQEIKILKQQKELDDLEQLKSKQKNWLIILGLILIALSAFTLSYIFYQKRKRSLIKFKANALKVNHEHQLELNKILTTSQEEERSRIAEKLHDEIGSMLAVVRFNLSSSPQNETVVLPNGQLQTASKVLADIADTIREMSHELMPVALNKLGLKQAIDQLIWDINSANKINIESVIMGLEQNEKQLAYDFQVNIYRIIQELFQNILKHANAKHVLFQFLTKDDGINIMVEDDGIGFNSNDEIGNGKGINLIKARLNHYKGKINVESGAGKGTLIIIDIPQK